MIATIGATAQGLRCPPMRRERARGPNRHRRSPPVGAIKTLHTALSPQAGTRRFGKMSAALQRFGFVDEVFREESLGRVALPGGRRAQALDAGGYEGLVCCRAIRFR